MAWVLKMDEVIESGLVHDFDASLSGIGQELGAGAYSMRYSASVGKACTTSRRGVRAAWPLPSRVAGVRGRPRDLHPRACAGGGAGRLPGEGASFPCRRSAGCSELECGARRRGAGAGQALAKVSVISSYSLLRCSLCWWQIFITCCYSSDSFISESRRRGINAP